MKTRRWIIWTMLAVFLLSALPALSATVIYKKHNIRGKRGYWTVYRSDWSRLWKSYLKVTVGANVSSITFQTGYDSHGGYGDCDMYVGKGFLPTTRSYTRRSAGSSHKEKITISNPSAGTYYLRLAGYRKYRTCFRIYYSTSGGGGTSWQQDMLNQVNYQRGRLGRAGVSINSQLQNMSQRYAFDMSSKGYYGGANHVGTAAVGVTFDDRIRNSGYLSGYGTWGGAENIARDYTSVSAVMNGWINSPGHYANMTNPNYVHAGFGGAKRSDNSYYRWVQMYGYRR